ncbi:cyclin-I-like [Scleropages formosus]|nr:cyclin-I-like [Scleropages formosus]
MKSPELAGCRLAGMLANALAREKRLWKVPVFADGRIQGTDISSFQHQDAVLWLGDLSKLFKFLPETFALGVCILNRLLASVKAQPKYLKCIAITSLILAGKINEEDEVIASVKDLVVQSGCNFSTAEIIRMERIILNKLHWDLYTATPVDFVHIFHALAMPGLPRLPRRRRHTEPFFHTALWIRQVQHCMACHQLSQFKGSTLALAIITLELERLTPDWFSVFTDLLKKAQVESKELIHCKEMADEHLSGQELLLSPNTLYIIGVQPPLDGGSGHSSRRGGRKRGEAHSEEQDFDAFYDGLGRLYGEAIVEDDVGQTTFTPCPPLQPPSQLNLSD